MRSHLLSIITWLKSASRAKIGDYPVTSLMRLILYGLLLILCVSYGINHIAGFEFSSTIPPNFEQNLDTWKESIHTGANFAWVLGFLLIISITGYETVSILHTAGQFSQIVYAFKNGLIKILLLYISTQLLHIYGDEVLILSHTQPEILFSLLVAAVCIMFVFKLTRRASYQNVMVAQAAEFRLFEEPSAIPNEIRNITAIHEAGHIITHGALKQPPDTMHASIIKRGNSLGRVLSSFQSLTSRVWLEWQMVHALAGQAAEQVIMGSTTDGTDKDMRDWENCARKYLANGFGEYYYLHPLNELECQFNAAALQTLRLSQKDVLSKFMNVNQGLLNELVNRLLEREEMTLDELLPYLNRVEGLEYLPRPDTILPLCATVNKED